MQKLGSIRADFEKLWSKQISFVFLFENWSKITRISPLFAAPLRKTHRQFLHAPVGRRARTQKINYLNIAFFSRFFRPWPHFWRKNTKQLMQTRPILWNLSWHPIIHSLKSLILLVFTRFHSFSLFLRRIKPRYLCGKPPTLLRDSGSKNPLFSWKSAF